MPHVGCLSLTLANDLALQILFHIVLQLAVVLVSDTMKETLESIAAGGLCAATTLHNVETLSQGVTTALNYYSPPDCQTARPSKVARDKMSAGH